MAKQYRWRAASTSTPPSTLSRGVLPENTPLVNWQTVNVGDPQIAALGYYYRDSNTKYAGQFIDALSSRVVFNTNQSWTSSVDSMNNITITMQTAIYSIVRDDIRGNDQNLPARKIQLYDLSTGEPDEGTEVGEPYYDSRVAEQHTIEPASVNFPTQVFTLAPGTSAEVKTIRVYNETQDSTHNYDNVLIGVRFENPLPAPVTYRLNYNANGGSSAPPTQSLTTVDDSHAFTVDQGVPTRANYRFDGWSESPSGPALYHGGDTFTIYRGDPNKTLYAIWTPYWTATVTYNANGGTGAPAAQTASVNPDYSSKSFTVPSGTPTWGYYRFLGWSHIQYVDSRTEADVEYRAGDTVTVTTSSPSLTLYAVWEMDYRPGKVWNGSDWLSHNRNPNGKANVRTSSTWKEMRTIGAPTAKNDPPTIYHDSEWYDMRKIGTE